ncbi:MAG: DUF1926 domain-containing protein [Spirochaetales bacterium]|nr:DUF1926 domain-containing protein [Spirochaetales bacterium]
MNEIKLVLGTYNSLPVSSTQEEFEYYFKHCYEPYLKMLNANPDFKSVLFYSGFLYEWFDKKKPEVKMLLKDLIKSKQVELISGAYYNAVLPLLPSTDRKAQIENLTNYICSSFKKRPKGFYVSKGVWEPSLPTTYTSSSAEYVFLDRQNFLASGIDEHHIYYPCITEDQGKKLIVYPANSSLASKVGFDDPYELARQIFEKCNSRFVEKRVNSDIRSKSLFSLLLPGETLGSNLIGLDNIFKDDWFGSFKDGLKKYGITLTLPLKENKRLGTLRKFYFGTTADSDITKMTLNKEQRKTYELMILHLNVDEMQALINTGQFRQFVNKYYESNNLYSKMLYVESLAKHTSDKSRKKSAKELIYSAQGHDVFWHGSHCGIYDNQLRLKIYNILLTAEKDIKTGSDFKTNFAKHDFNFDGSEELLYNGIHFNAYIDRDSAAIFEFDYFPTCTNYCACMSKYEEYYHSDIDLHGYHFDLKPRYLFDDKIFEVGTKYSDFFLGIIDNKLDSEVYTIDDFDGDKKSVGFVEKVDFELAGLPSSVEINKNFSFRKNDIEVEYLIKNEGSKAVEFNFATSLNLTFGEWSKESINLLKDDDLLDFLAKEHKHISKFNIEDLKNKNKINFSSTRHFDIWVNPIYTQTLVYDKIENRYQCTDFMPVWKLKLDSQEEFRLQITMSVIRS